MWVRVVVAIGLLFLPTVVFAQAEKRIALLIGNQGYGGEIGRLANPHNDVALLEKTLKALGFEVRTVRDAGLAGLHQAVNAYARRLQAAGLNAVGFFYYSGHGAADAGTNYLIPVDVKTTETGELWDQSLRLSEITRKLKGEAGNATHFIVFDACRNTLKLTRAGSRALVQSKGFVPVAQESGMLIAYATAEGELASDVGVEAGPYAKTLAEEIVKPGVEAVVMFRNVQRRVRAAIKQEPYLGFNAMDDVYLAGAAPPAMPETTAAAREWAGVDKSSLAELETFVRRHASTAEADYARARINDLKQQKVAPPATKRELPTTVTGTLRCESYSVRADCESDAFCSWADDRKQCQRKSGSLATAMLETSPKATAPTTCSGVEALVGNEKRCLKPGDSFKDCPECPEMVVVPAGSFTMGANESPFESPLHNVSIAKPFAVGKFEVKFAEWDACIAERGCKHRPDDFRWGRANRPVVSVSWRDIANEFLPWLSGKTGRRYRLLSEAEWEYAARAGSGSRFYWGDDIGKGWANCDGCGSRWDKQTAPAGSFAANAFGLHDMQGNASEWVEDCWHDDYVGAPSDGAAWISACEKSALVQRSGSWMTKPADLSSAYRYSGESGRRSDTVGFRVARTLNP
jgi:formylglycine-generating enzyme required for sulfatase activity